MKSIIKKTFAIVVMTNCLLLGGCKKYLDQKSNQQLATPQTFQDVQSLLDDDRRVNVSDPDVGDVSADGYYLSEDTYNGMDIYNRNMYTWQAGGLFEPGSFNDWGYSFDKVYIANVVLDNVDKVKRTPHDDLQYGNAKGGALYLRGRMFLLNAWIWTLAYDDNTANTDLGLPLRLNPDFNEVSVRSSVQQTYDQILSDFKGALALLPVKAVHPLRASQPAACGWLARTYLSMRQYDSALFYADRALQVYDTLIDYNTLDTAAQTPFQSYNAETIYYSECREARALYPPGCKVDSILYASYEDNDLRKQLFNYSTGPNQYTFKGSYAGSTFFNLPFSGIATDELLITRAECYAYTGNTTAAMNDLNKLLVKRWRTGTFIPYTAIDAADALQKIRTERRKELRDRCVRWMDIKRYNKEGAGIILTRIIGGQTFTLPPNDLRYALPIPEDIIKISGMVQNPR